MKSSAANYWLQESLELTGLKKFKFRLDHFYYLHIILMHVIFRSRQECELGVYALLKDVEKQEKFIEVFQGLRKLMKLGFDRVSRCQEIWLFTIRNLWVIVVD